jgi:hypothetical protein
MRWALLRPVTGLKGDAIGTPIRRGGSEILLVDLLDSLTAISFIASINLSRSAMDCVIRAE